MNARRKTVLCASLVVAVWLSVACSPAAAPAPAYESSGAAAAPTMAPAPTAAADGVEVASADKSRLGDVGISPYRANRMIIKNGEMSLMVADTNRAIDQVTDIAVNSGGYIVSSRTWEQDDLRFATLTMGVPSDQFEAVQRQLRALAVKVLNDTASGQDVSDEYVDLQSRLTNLEATAARIREFLDQAKTVEEALQVNTQLTQIEGEIEQVKGRMQYLKDRSAYSTIVVNLEPKRPTPTPTPEPTPIGWRPEQTLKEATNTLSDVLRNLGDLAIWLVVVVAPFAVPVGIVATLVRRGRTGKGARSMEASSEVKREE